VLAAEFSDLIPAEHSVLDIGCGDGLIDALILQRRGDLTITGADVLLRARTHVPMAVFDGERLPFADCSVDSVMFCDVLHHAKDPVRLLREGARVARDCVLIKDHIADGLLATSTLRLMDYIGNSAYGVALPYNYFTRAQWDEAFRSVGLTQQTIRRRLSLYPPVANLVFGRSLHFVARFHVER